MSIIGISLIVIGLGYTFFVLAILSSVVRRGRNLYRETLPVSADAVAGLDIEKLRGLTWQFQELGFVHLQDYTSQVYSSPDGQRNPNSSPPIADPIADAAVTAFAKLEDFSRIMVHLEQGCFGCIQFLNTNASQGSASKARWLFAEIYSLSGVEAGDWSYATNNQDFPINIDLSIRVVRQPRWLTTEIKGASIQELLNVHLRRREEVAVAAGVTWQRRLELTDHHEMISRAYAASRHFYASMTAWKLRKRLLQVRSGRKSSEWLGELEGRLTVAR
ncbi:hypothetical protein EON80_06640 [bacterium]|nr:MAG: hypothetical protein EON80_06640 [bacterium]